MSVHISYQSQFAIASMMNGDASAQKLNKPADTLIDKGFSGIRTVYPQRDQQ